MAYIYQADVWCDDCGRAICERLTHEGNAPADPQDESSYDSDYYPKQVDDDDESDTPQHCAGGPDCLNAITLPDGDKVGLLFGELTRDGVEYVKEAQRELQHGRGSADVVALWIEHYGGKGYNF